MKLGHIEHFDSDYERVGVCWVLISFELSTRRCTYRGSVHGRD
jgi:hypothetical protein